MTGRATQHRIGRSLRFYKFPLLIETVVLLDLSWEIVRANLTEEQLDWLPFAPSTLGVAPSAALAGVLGVLILTRGQYAMVSMPWLAGHGTGWTLAENHIRWTLSVSNAGAGLARIEQVAYQVGWEESPTRLGAVEFASAEECRTAFTCRGHESGADFSFADISPGHPLRPQTGADGALVLFWFTPTMMVGLSRFEVRIQFGDLLGDTYEWSRDLLTVMEVDTQARRALRPSETTSHQTSAFARWRLRAHGRLRSGLVGVRLAKLRNGGKRSGR